MSIRIWVVFERILDLVCALRQMAYRWLSDVEYLELQLEYFERLQASEGGYSADIDRIKSDLAKVRRSERSR